MDPEPTMYFQHRDVQKCTQDLSAESFLKKPTVQKLSKRDVLNLKDMVVTLAEYEGLYAHAESFKKRAVDVEKMDPEIIMT